MSIVEARDVVRTFTRGGQQVLALRGVDLRVEAGTMMALHGRSGSGKTTLLNIIGGLDGPTSGSVEVCGTDLVAAGEKARIALRRDRIAFIFQAFGLLPVLSAAENVEVPLRLHRMPADERRSRVAELLELVGLGHRGAHRPAELSGGEQQRVAIARALANRPELLIADEPTGQLDSGTGRHIMDLLRDLVDHTGLAMLVATHDPTLLADADEVRELGDGVLSVGGTVAPRFDGDIDRSRTLSESTTLPQARADEHAAFRPHPDEVHQPPHDPTLLRGPARQQADPSVDGDDRDAPRGDDRHAPRWGRDGEVIDDSPDRR